MDLQLLVALTWSSYAHKLWQTLNVENRCSVSALHNEIKTDCSWGVYMLQTVNLFCTSLLKGCRQESTRVQCSALVRYCLALFSSIRGCLPDMRFHLSRCSVAEGKQGSQSKSRRKCLRNSCSNHRDIQGHLVLTPPSLKGSSDRGPQVGWETPRFHYSC